jgi:hypothetical protein
MQRGETQRLNVNMRYTEQRELIMNAVQGLRTLLKLLLLPRLRSVDSYQREGKHYVIPSRPKGGVQPQSH